MEYNTTRNHLTMKEYGRHMQKMIEFVQSIEDKEVRQKNAYSVIELMGFLNPHLKNVEDFRHKLWDHLFLISDFKLDVESPYPIPTKETLKAGPMQLKYPKRYPKFSHLGKNLELIINKALKEQNPEKRSGFSNAVAYYMKLAYNNWHKETVHDDAIQSELSILTEGQLEFTNTPYVKSYRPNENRERENRGNYGDYRNKRNQKFQPRSNRSNDTRDTRGNDNRGNDNRGNDNRGNDNRGNDIRGNDNRGNDNRGNDNRGNDNRGNDSRGNDNRGNDNRGNDSRGNESRGENRGNTGGNLNRNNNLNSNNNKFKKRF